MTEQPEPFDHRATARAAIAILSRTHHDQDIDTADLLGDVPPVYVINFLAVVALHAYRQGGFDIDHWLTMNGLAFSGVDQ